MGMGTLRVRVRVWAPIPGGIPVPFTKGSTPKVQGQHGMLLQPTMRTHTGFKPGEKAYLDSLDINTTWPSWKLSHQFLGPYPGVCAVGKNAYHLRLPYSMCQLHPVFNVVKLLRAPKALILGRHPKPPPDLQIIDGEPEYEVEAILDSWHFCNRLQFLISWKGYGYEENTWTDEDDVRAPDLVREFYQKNPGAPCCIHAVHFGKFPFHPAHVVTSPRGGSDVRGTHTELQSPNSDQPSWPPADYTYVQRYLPLCSHGHCSYSI
jgi:hypothetical protein